MAIQGREFHTLEGKRLRASQIRLATPEAKPRSLYWCVRFALDICWPTIGELNAFYIDGIVDDGGNWIADFAEPTQNKPTTFKRNGAQ